MLFVKSKIKFSILILFLSLNFSVLLSASQHKNQQEEFTNHKKVKIFSQTHSYLFNKRLRKIFKNSRLEFQNINQLTQEITQRSTEGFYTIDLDFKGIPFLHKSSYRLNSYNQEQTLPKIKKSLLQAQQFITAFLYNLDQNHDGFIKHIDFTSTGLTLERFRKYTNQYFVNNIKPLSLNITFDVYEEDKFTSASSSLKNTSNYINQIESFLNPSITNCGDRDNTSTNIHKESKIPQTINDFLKYQQIIDDIYPVFVNKEYKDESLCKAIKDMTVFHKDLMTLLIANSYERLSISKLHSNYKIDYILGYFLEKDIAQSHSQYAGPEEALKLALRYYLTAFKNILSKDKLKICESTARVLTTLHGPEMISELPLFKEVLEDDRDKKLLIFLQNCVSQKGFNAFNQLMNQTPEFKSATFCYNKGFIIENNIGNCHTMLFNSSKLALEEAIVYYCLAFEAHQTIQKQEKCLIHPDEMSRRAANALLRTITNLKKHILPIES